VFAVHAIVNIDYFFFFKKSIAAFMFQSVQPVAPLHRRAGPEENFTVLPACDLPQQRTNLNITGQRDA
jgi:hypothetical protein